MPRQPLSSVPFALYSGRAGKADQAAEAAHAVLADSALTADLAKQAPSAADAIREKLEAVEQREIKANLMLFTKGVNRHD